MKKFEDIQGKQEYPLKHHFPTLLTLTKPLQQSTSRVRVTMFIYDSFIINYY